ncbi:hypothetical protein SKAU_G00390950 [Synaphobranchus kaupii]|uniref:Uncharacterized protein n=1 Tax=Synaphobranchus kaupii TaxID=118154 RepID=A0A9Q1EBE6_SYNKA|nr:hypothetical protein SKAU_G00390950 [Synaphobranchus kaupii]
MRGDELDGHIAECKSAGYGDSHWSHTPQVVRKQSFQENTDAQREKAGSALIQPSPRSCSITSQLLRGLSVRVINRHTWRDDAAAAPHRAPSPPPALGFNGSLPLQSLTKKNSPGARLSAAIKRAGLFGFSTRTTWLRARIRYPRLAPGPRESSRADSNWKA